MRAPAGGSRARPRYSRTLTRRRRNDAGSVYRGGAAHRGRPQGRQARGLAPGGPRGAGARRADRADRRRPGAGRGRDHGLRRPGRRAGRSTSPATRCWPRSCPRACPATTIDRQCGSSQQALHFAAQAVMSGTMDVVIAGGVESMTRVPMGSSDALPAQNGFGTSKSPSMEAALPGVEFSQFTGAEMIAREVRLHARRARRVRATTATARRSPRREAGLFDGRDRAARGRARRRLDGAHAVDEGMRFDATLEGIARGQAAAPEGGASPPPAASQICDGASGVHGRQRARPDGAGRRAAGAHPPHERVGADPVIMLEAPIPATRGAEARPA